ncbi:hypothetical protein [Bradyrhizobium sp. AUGA SZCCT0283]|uniref:hypothetical protein n=1 Tax=Bradyrhizobium sp. AUGA SZCCT0283 TaxID=2807671 RepID=UPI001BA4AF0B|nr:hypothetical protein [Bradyrhizobium sp. AUGA SZCCT0283]MBR1279522.1 hypothetical protein [Bradyrhizobium sp. AUGA SZCCT0283]
MLRWMTPFLVAIFAIGTAAADDTPAPTSADSPATTSAGGTPAPKSAVGNPAPKRAARKNAAVRAASQLPPGLPRAHYNYRTTVAPAPAPLYVRRGHTLVVEEEDPDVLFTPVGVVPYAPRVFGTPLLPGSSTLPGYYGTNHSYSYDGPYYGGPSYGPYWNRLPYACGVYGYC